LSQGCITSGSGVRQRPAGRQLAQLEGLHPRGLEEIDRHGASCGVADLSGCDECRLSQSLNGKPDYELWIIDGCGGHDDVVDVARLVQGQ
jgi:hypothetical protein